MFAAYPYCCPKWKLFLLGLMLFLMALKLFLAVLRSYLVKLRLFPVEWKWWCLFAPCRGSVLLSP